MLFLFGIAETSLGRATWPEYLNSSLISFDKGKHCAQKCSHSLAIGLKGALTRYLFPILALQMSTLEEVNSKTNELICFIARETMKDCEECSAIETSKDDEVCELYDEICCLCLINMEKHVNDIKATLVSDDANTRMDSLKNKFTEKVNSLVTALDDAEIANEELKEDNARYKRAYEQQKKLKVNKSKLLKVLKSEADALIEENKALKRKLDDADLDLKYKNMEIKNLEAAAEDMKADHKKEFDEICDLHDSAMREAERLRSRDKRSREM